MLNIRSKKNDTSLYNMIVLLQWIEDKFAFIVLKIVWFAVGYLHFSQLLLTKKQNFFFLIFFFFMKVDAGCCSSIYQHSSSAKKHLHFLLLSGSGSRICSLALLNKQKILQVVHLSIFSFSLFFFFFFCKQFCLQKTKRWVINNEIKIMVLKYLNLYFQLKNFFKDIFPLAYKKIKF